jgi:hypothetical protein
MDDDRYWPETDPRNMLPFSCQMEPDDPTVIKLPKAYGGNNQQVYWNGTS